MKYTFDDVLIKPEFSTIDSRKEVDISSDIGFGAIDLPIISANMDTVTGVDMAVVMRKSGAIGCLHRFCSVEESVKHYMSSPPTTIVSFGLGKREEDRVRCLQEAGATLFCLDVAHGAQQQVVNQTIWFKKNFPEAWLMVGNFGNPESLVKFLDKCQGVKKFYYPDAIKIGIGPGAACTTRMKTGVGYPQLSAVNDVAEMFSEIFSKGQAPKLIADGGMKTSGDIAKALACGADAAMLGSMLAGTDETPGDVHYKQYKGSASKESYEGQGKDWDCAEGESFTVDYKGPVENILKDIKGGLRSSFSYVGARNLKEFQDKSEFIMTSSNVVKENIPHGKNNI